MARWRGHKQSPDQNYMLFINCSYSCLAGMTLPKLRSSLTIRLYMTDTVKGGGERVDTVMICGILYGRCTTKLSIEAGLSSYTKSNHILTSGKC